MDNIVRLDERKRLIESFKDDSYLQNVDMPYYGVIYKISNDVNDMVYIGKTRRFNSRASEHTRAVLNSKYDERSSHVLYNAIREIGYEHFKMEIIDIAYSAEELADKEVREIVKYKSILPEYGYNTTVDRMKYLYSNDSSLNRSVAHIGRKSSSLTKLKNSIPVVAVNIDKRQWIYADSSRLIARVIMNNIHRSICAAAVRNMKVLNNWYIIYVDKIRALNMLDKLDQCDDDIIRDNFKNLYEMVIDNNVENIERLFTIYNLNYENNEDGYVFEESSRVCNITEVHVS